MHLFVLVLKLLLQTPVNEHLKSANELSLGFTSETIANDNWHLNLNFRSS